VRRTYRYDPETKTLVPLHKWLAKYGSATKTHHVIPDIEPYVAVAGDMAGKVIHSRKEHREFLRRNNFVEIGNERDYMTRHGGMSPDNPNLVPDKRREEQLWQTLKKTEEQLRNRRS
jgi:hypothetical protein